MALENKRNNQNTKKLHQNRQGNWVTNHMAPLKNTLGNTDLEDKRC